MKKLFVIFFSLFYLVVSSGFTQYQHTCKAMAVKMYSLTNDGHQNSDEPCPICSSKEKDLTKKKEGCCDHEAKIVKVDDTVKNQVQFDFVVKIWGDAIPNKMLGTVFDYSIITDDTKLSNPYLTSKVPIRGNPLYILHCVYRI
jgi:hypothetical protein